MDGNLLAEAVAHHQAGRLAEAERLYRRILADQPDHPDALHLLGLVAHACGHGDHARQLIGQAVRLRPDAPHYLQNLAEVLAAGGDPAGAAECCRRASALAPADPAPCRMLARFLTALGDMAGAGAALERLAELCPDDPAAAANLGETLRARGRFGPAADAFRRALALAPGNMDAAYGLGLCLLSLGEMAEGARLYEAGRFGGRRPRLDILPGVPAWDGLPMPKGRLLLHPEQGAGDVIQFIRYVPWLKERVGGLILPHRPDLDRLLRRVEGIDHRPGPGEPPPACDAFVPLLSLLALFEGRFPAPASYLSADPRAVADWRKRLSPPDGRARVGLVWAGNPGHHNDRNRSIPLAAFDALLGLPGVAWHALQVGPAAADPERLGWAGRITDLSPGIADFADTAAAISALDLVVTVDTSVLHLAGAMGRPAWGLIPQVSDWRWVAGREDSAWYPSIRLFRQADDGGWPPVLARLSRALAELTPPAG